MRIFARPLYPSGVGFQFGVSLRYPLYTPHRVPGFELLAANRHETGQPSSEGLRKRVVLWSAHYSLVTIPLSSAIPRSKL
jgi:hypothetical protein